MFTYKRQAYWKPASRPARNIFEKLAQSVFDQHTKEGKLGQFDPKRSGAEWWIQCRSTKKDQGGETSSNLLENSSIGFHFDLDYGTEVPPNLGTVTYVSSGEIGGAPTVVLGCEHSEWNGSNKSKKVDISQGCLSFPESGKHITFKGDLLHGCPEQLMALNNHSEATGPLTKKQRKALMHKVATPPTKKPASDNGLRITFLVNIWLDSGAPTNIPEFCMNLELPGGEFLGFIDSSTAIGCKTSLKRMFLMEKEKNSEGKVKKTVRFDFNQAPKEGVNSDDESDDEEGVNRLGGEKIPQVLTTGRSPCFGVTFGKQDDQLWMPIPELGGVSSKAEPLNRPSTFHINFKGGNAAPCCVKGTGGGGY